MPLKNAFFILAFLPAVAIAQAPSHTLKVGAAYTQLPYTSVNTVGAVVGYNYTFRPRMTLSTHLGFFKDVETAMGRFAGVLDGVTYDNSFQYETREQMAQLDLNWMYALARPDNPNQFRVGTGGTLVYSRLDYPVNTYINKGIIESMDRGIHEVVVPMFNVALENQFHITPHLAVFGRLVFQTAFTEQHDVDQRINYDFGFSSTTGGILNLGTATLGLGYAF